MRNASSQNSQPASVSGDPAGLHRYEYAVVRFCPDIEREEFVNIGVVMMCKRRRWLGLRLNIDEDRIKALFPKSDFEALRRQLEGMKKVAAGDRSPIGSLEVHERFRWLSAVRSACITTSRPHPGLCADLEATLDALFERQVLGS